MEHYVIVIQDEVSANEFGLWSRAVARFSAMMGVEVACIMEVDIREAE